MDQKEFVQKSDELLKSMNMASLRSCLHNIARKTPKDEQEAFLEMLNDFSSLKDHVNINEKLQFKRLMSDDMVNEKLSEIKSTFEDIENGDLYISAHGYEDYSRGYWSDNWVWVYEDETGIGSMIQDAVLFARDCMNDCRYEEAVSIFEVVMDTQIHVEDEEGGDSFFLSLDEMVDEKLAEVNLKELALNVLYSNYQLQPADQRAEALYSYFTYPYFKDVHIEDIFSIGREELMETDEFLRSWIDFLLRRSGDIAARLLKEGILYHNGADGLAEIARQGCGQHPSIYLTSLLEFEKIHAYEKMIDIGEEALDKLSDDMKIRGEIALKAAFAAYNINDNELMKKFWYEAFYSNSTISNYLRLFIDSETIEKYKVMAEKRVEELHIIDNCFNKNTDETAVNNILRLDYQCLNFFSGNFTKVRNWCMEQKKPLGWSGNFIGCGVDLMLLYLYADKKLKKAGEKVAENVSSMTGFNDSKNLLFMDDSSMFDIEVTLQKSVDIFWNIFCLWKVNYTISAEDIENHMKWLESVIDKRIDGIVSGKYRNKYSDVALLAAALGEVKESLGMIISKGIIINRYLERYSRYSAFRSALKKYLE